MEVLECSQTGQRVREGYIYKDFLPYIETRGHPGLKAKRIPFLSARYLSFIHIV
jgi:hypothetical protein